jgi:capsular polysaccharide transport system ATP-binding protein
MPLKELAKEKKDFFFAALSILFSFDVCVAPHSKYLLFLMSREAKPLRNLFRKQLDGGLSMISNTKNNQFKRQFCNRGMVLGPLGKVIFDGDLDEAIAFSKQNDIVDNSTEADDMQFDYGENQANANSSESEDDIDF